MLSLVSRVLLVLCTLSSSMEAVVSSFAQTSEPNNIIPTTAFPTSAHRLRRPDLKVTWELQVAQQIQQKRSSSILSTTTHLNDSTTTAQQQQQQQQSRKQPYMVAVVGMPGSGKTTGAEILTELLCGDDGENNCNAFCMPFDGYHYSIDALKQRMMEASSSSSSSRSTDLIYRRGSPETFDAAALRRDLERIRYGDEANIALPGFDHAVGDPEDGQHIFCREQHSVVITEGLYLLHDQDGWCGIKDCFDMTVYVDADLDVCMNRLKIRNQSIPGYTVDEILARVDAVDRMNALIVQASKPRADLVVRSAAF
jgi:pantothenate kinase